MKVFDLQDRLMRMGYYTGPKDGKENPDLIEAIERAKKNKAFIPAHMLENETPKKRGK